MDQTSETVCQSKLFTFQIVLVQYFGHSDTKLTSLNTFPWNINKCHQVGLEGDSVGIKSRETVG